MRRCSRRRGRRVLCASKPLTNVSIRWRERFTPSRFSNRMKKYSILPGKLGKAVVRPPLMKLPAAEIEGLRMTLAEAGLLGGAQPWHLSLTALEPVRQRWAELTEPDGIKPESMATVIFFTLWTEAWKPEYSILGQLHQFQSSFPQFVGCFR